MALTRCQSSVRKLFHCSCSEQFRPHRSDWHVAANKTDKRSDTSCLSFHWQSQWSAEFIDESAVHVPNLNDARAARNRRVSQYFFLELDFVPDPGKLFSR